MPFSEISLYSNRDCLIISSAFCLFILSMWAVVKLFALSQIPTFHPLFSLTGGGGVGRFVDVYCSFHEFN